MLCRCPHNVVPEQPAVAAAAATTTTIRPSWRRRAKAKNEFRASLAVEERRQQDRNLPPHSLICNSLHGQGCIRARMILPSSLSPDLTTTPSPRFWASSSRCFMPAHPGRVRVPKMHSNARKQARKRKVTAASCLGLVLAWFRSQGSEFIFQG
jgi:hypothetical protein